MKLLCYLTYGIENITLSVNNDVITVVEAVGYCINPRFLGLIWTSSISGTRKRAASDNENGDGVFENQDGGNENWPHDGPRNEAVDIRLSNASTQLRQSTKHTTSTKIEEEDEEAEDVAGHALDNGVLYAEQASSSIKF